MKSKRGQTLGLSIISGLVVLIVGLLVVNFLSEEVDRARTDLNCSSAATISNGTRLLCLAVDFTIIYWVIIIFSVLIGGITGRVIGSR